MEISYWHSRWENDKTGWHMDYVYPPLKRIWPQLSIESEAHVLVPLCGKNLDIHWLIDQGCTVTGVDISQKALEHIMKNHSESFTEDSSHGFTIYRSKSLALWQGDFIKLPTDKVPPADLIYDTKAIIALPAEMRSDYAKKLLSLTHSKTQILIQTLQYEQSEMNGPPFSVDEQELKHLLGNRFTLKCIHEQSKLEELQRFQQRGLSSYLKEKIYHLTPLK